MTNSLFSLRNELRADATDEIYVELNPAVVSTDSGRKYALSAVCLGPELEGDKHGLSLEVSCDGERATLEAVHQQTETTGASESLTVALFSVSRSFLEILAAARAVEIGIGNPTVRLSRRLDAENRRNVSRFLNLAAIPRALASPGLARLAAGAVA